MVDVFGHTRFKRKHHLVSDFFRHQPARVSSRLHVLEPGIYVLRYDNAEDGLHPPRLLLNAVDRSQLLTFEDGSIQASSQFLEMGDLVFCRVRQQSSFAITILSGFGTLSDRISLLVERLDQTLDRIPAEVSGQASPSVRDTYASFLELPSVEKLGLVWTGKPPELDLEYSFHIAEWGWLPFMRPGSSLSLPQEREVNGISIQLVGPLAMRYQIHLDVDDESGKSRFERGHSVLVSPLTNPHVIKRIGIRLVLIDPTINEMIQPKLGFLVEPTEKASS